MGEMDETGWINIYLMRLTLKEETLYRKAGEFLTTSIASPQNH